MSEQGTQNASRLECGSETGGTGLWRQAGDVARSCRWLALLGVAVAIGPSGGCGCEGKSTDDGVTSTHGDTSVDGQDADTDASTDDTTGDTTSGTDDGEPACGPDAPTRYSDECPGEDLWSTANHCGECGHYCTTVGLDSRGNLLPACVCGECQPFWSDCRHEGSPPTLPGGNCNDYCANYGGGTECIPFGCGGHTLLLSVGSDPFYTQCGSGQFIDGHDCETPIPWTDEDFEWAACCCFWPEG